MALGWLTVLKTVPWTEVIGHAPLVAEGARKLWQAVGARPVEVPAAEPPAAPAASPRSQVEIDAQRLEALERRLATAEAALQPLQAQVRTSTELIKALADQNEALVRGVEALRKRAVWLSAGCLLAGAAAVGALALLAWGTGS